MPKGLVKDKQDEKKWDKAKKIVHRQYPNYTEEDESFWKLVNSIYSGMNKSSTVDLGLMKKAVELSFLCPGVEDLDVREFSIENYYLLKNHFENMEKANYKLQGKRKFQGMDISIENKPGSIRRGKDPDGNEWKTKMKIPYGYIRLTEGADGDCVDCFIGEDEESKRVYVIHQNNPLTGKYDEDKVMLGFNNDKEAKKAYCDHYDNPEKFFGSMEEFKIDDFKSKVKSKKGKISGPDMEMRKSDKEHYKKEDLKGKGLRWVTVRGQHVLVQGVEEGGYVVVGGAGGKLNHFKIDKLLPEDEYRKQLKEKKEAKLKDITPEERKEQTKLKKEEIEAKKGERASYEEKVKTIMGEEYKTILTTKDLEEISEVAKKRMAKKNKVGEEKIAKLMEEKPEEYKKEEEAARVRMEEKKIKQLESRALNALATDYFGDEIPPDKKQNMQDLLNVEKAKEILKARREFRQKLKDITRGRIGEEPEIKIGTTFAEDSSSIDDDIVKEVKQHVETQKNVQLYEKLNAQGLAAQKHIDEGGLATLNGVGGDIFKVKGIFNQDVIQTMGIESCSRIVAAKIHADGRTEEVKEALHRFAKENNMKVVDKALKESEERFANADEIRKLAEDSDDVEAILSKASANGYALRQLVAGQKNLGSAVGSLRATAHLINALEEGPVDSVQVDMGHDLFEARKKARIMGLGRDDYSLKTKDKRIVMEIPKDSLGKFFNTNVKAREKENIKEKIKAHKMNDGYKPEGMQSKIKLDASQEAGLRFFKETGKAVLDFEAGIGKTPLGYAACLEAMNNKGAKKCLVVTPAKLRSQFFQEREKFLTPDRQKLVTLNDKGPKQREQNYKKDGIIIIGHDQLRTDKELLEKAGFDMMVVDEAHELTNPNYASDESSGRMKGLQSLGKIIPYKIAMTGTNIKNSKRELWKKIDFVDPNHTLGSMKDFERRYEGLNQGTTAVQEGANDAFRREIGQWVYSQRTQLPVKNNIKRIKVDLTKAQRKAYKESEAKYAQERANEGEKIGAASRRDARNYQILHNGDPQNNSKAQKILDIMENDHKGEKAVIHLQGRKAMDTIKTTLEAKYGKGSVVAINGDTAKKEADSAKAEFNNPESKVRFIIGTKSLEAGHNLQFGGTVTFHYDIPPTFASFDQRNKRIFRKGQNKDVATYVLESNSPFDMSKRDILDRKEREMDILGNPREIEGHDETGLLGILNSIEKEKGAPGKAMKKALTIALERLGRKVDEISAAESLLQSLEKAIWEDRSIYKESPFQKAKDVTKKNAMELEDNLDTTPHIKKKELESGREVLYQCRVCKKYREDDKWVNDIPERFENYDAQSVVGRMCPDCMERHMREIDGRSEDLKERVMI